MVTRPATPPYSSITIAMWLRDWRNSRSSTFRRLDSGISTAGRSSSCTLAGAVVGDHAAQQVLGQQDAEDLVLVLAMHREARVAGFDHQLHQVEELGVGRQRDHLRARDHHVADGEVGHRDRAFHHPQRVGGDQAVGLRVAQQLDQVFAGGGLAGKRRADAFEPGAALFLRAFRGFRCVGTVVFGHGGWRGAAVGAAGKSSAEPVAGR